LLIDLNQAEVLANRLQEKREWSSRIDWDRVFREKRDMEAMFPELVSELKSARFQLEQSRSELEEARTKLRQARGRTKYLMVMVDMARTGDW